MRRLVAIWLLLFAARGQTAGLPSPWQPDYGKLQLAGNIGFMAAGLGERFLDGRLQSDVFIGYLPARIGATAVTTYALKHSWIYARPALWRDARLPLYAGVTLLYVDGLRLREGEDDFYEPYATHLMPYLGMELAHRYGSGGDERRVGVYLEVGALDVFIEDYISEQNDEYLALTDILNLAVGLRFEM